MGRALSKAAGDTEVWVADSPLGPAAIHRELCRLEKWAVEEQSHTLIHAGALQLEKSLHREGPGVLELDRSQQCAPDQADSMGCRSRGQRWPFPLLTREQCPEWDTDTAGNPAEGHKGIWGLQHLSYKERMRQQGLFSQKKAQEDSYQHIIIWRGQQRWSQALVRDGQWQNTGGSMWAQEHTFTVRLTELQQVAQGHSVLPWRSKAIWTPFWPARPRWDSWSRGLGQHDFQGSLPTSISLWFCEQTKTSTFWKKWQSLFFFLI